MDIHEQIDALADEIKSRSCYQEIAKQNDLMEHDEEVIRLAYAFSIAQSEYSDGLKHYSEDSPELKALYNKMKDAKWNLDMHPIVSRYYELLSQVNEPLNYLQFNLISKFNTKPHGCK